MAGSAQTTDTDRRAKLPREIRDLIDQTPAAPPELGADILLRLVEAGKIPDKKIKAEVLEQAFVLAGSARFPMRLIGATRHGSATDSDVGVRWRALRQRTGHSLAALPRRFGQCWKSIASARWNFSNPSPHCGFRRAILLGFDGRSRGRVLCHAGAAGESGV